MRKLFLKSVTLLFLLGMSVNGVWAGSDLINKLPNDKKLELMSQTYCARLTGHPSSTGGGKVYVNTPELGQSEAADPRPRKDEEDTYREGVSNVAVNGLGVAMSGMDAAKIGICAWAKPDDGYWLAGWSYSNMGTDLGTTSNSEKVGMYYAAYETSIVKNDTIDYVIYATFEPIRFAGYTVSGNNTTVNRICNLTVTLSIAGTELDTADFKAPVLAASEGGGSWTSEDGDDWKTTDLTIHVDEETEEATVAFGVKFTAPDDNAAEYSAEIVMETKAGIKISVPLDARTVIPGVKAFRYNKDEVLQESGTIATLLANAGAKDIIKLNGDCDSPITIAKEVTLDINGYTLSNSLTIASGGNVTLAFNTFGEDKNGGTITGNVLVAQNATLTLVGTSINGTLTNNGTVYQNGATIKGEITNNGTMTTTDGKHTAKLTSRGTLNINGGSFLPETGNALCIKGGTATIKRATITTASDVAILAEGGTTTLEKQAKVSGYPATLNTSGSGRIVVNCAKFDDISSLFYSPDPAEWPAGVTMKSAYFKTNTMNLTNELDPIVMWRNTAGAEYREGYEFFLGTVEDAKTAKVSMCHIGATSYYSLEDALTFVNVNSNPATIIMDNDYTLPAGYYTLPANAVLIVPADNEQGAERAIVKRIYSKATPTLFRKLTLEKGVDMVVAGKIEIGGSQYSGDDSYTGAVAGDYAQLQMNEGSHITLQYGSVLRAWGYVTGDIAKQDANHNVPMGEIDARRGASVYEFFQMGDWGNTIINGVGLVAGDTHFPINSYYIQNVEVPVKYHPGAKQTSVTTVSAGGMITMCANDIQIIGVTKVDTAMFLMDQEADAENTWVRKWYDASKDQQVYEINSGAHIGNLVINLASSPLFDGLEDILAGMGGIFGTAGEFAQEAGAEFHQDLIMNSGQYVLPITSNFKLHLLSGTLDFTQSTELIPGAELEIDKGATVYVTDQKLPNVEEGSLYIYDYQDWVAEAMPNLISYSPIFEGVPSTRDVSSLESVGSAVVNVHGTFDTSEGYVFTSENGGNIFSSVEDAGTFTFTSAAKAKDYYEDVKVSSSLNFSEKKIEGETKRFYSAFLKNSDEWVENGGDRYVQTGGTEAGLSYCYLDIDNKGGRWTQLEQRGCFTYDDVSKTYYIKPQEYVAVAVSSATQNGKNWIIEGNSDHTYSDAAQSGRLFILTYDKNNNCQWWEVEQKDNYYHCIHPNNDTYYEWKDGEWQEVRFTITWLNWDGTQIKSYDYTNPKSPKEIDYSVTYGTMAEYLGEKPIRDIDPENPDYTYSFVGWSPALGPVTSNVTYMAVYDKQQIKYTVIFMDGVEIERGQWARNEIPVCENIPTKTGYTLEWEPAIIAVTCDTTYTAKWLKKAPTEYAITFYDYDGKNELQKSPVAVGSTPTPPTITNGKPVGSSGKPATSEYTYVFDHWSPAIEEVSATSAKSYVAVYKEKPQTYTITFKNGSETIESKEYAYGETPVCSTPPTKDNTAEWTYKLTWTPQIQAVTEPATYTADFETYKTKNKYTVSVKCSPSGAAVLTGGGIYEYNTASDAVTVSVTNKADGYDFVGWADLAENDANKKSMTRQMAVTGDIELVAEFYCSECDNVTISWRNEDGTLLKEVKQAKGTASTYTGATPTKAATAQNTFTFDGWTTAANGAGTYYKSGMTPRANANASYFAHFAATPIPNLDVNSVSGPTVLSEPVTYHDLVITSNGVTSAQLVGVDYLTLTGDAYFDLAINAKDHKWYAIAVPWQVDAEKGISVNGRTLTFGREFDILYYNGATRAEEGTTGNAWTYMEDTHSAGDRILQPGVLYMIGLTHEAPVIRFKANNKSKLLNTNTSVTAYPSENAVDANWNGIANPALFNAYVNAGVTLGQVYNASTNSYSTINLDSKKLVLGQPVFVQAPVAKSITVTYGGAYAAPRRAKAQTENTEYDVRIAPANAAYTDRLFVAVDDKENDTYTIGQDLAKMGVSTIVAQMWVNRYNTKLCQNTVAPVNGTAEFPLTISAPQEGRYVISIDQSALTAQNDLYLTYDGEVIWNLTNSAYTTTLQQGTDTHYGLRIKVENAPEVATDINEAIVDSKDTTANKVLINGHVFIIRGERAYTIDGQLVK